MGLRYPAVVNYLALTLRLASSVAFSVIVARRLPVSEYGVWGVILSVSLALTNPVTLISTWPPRMESWGHRGAGYTGLLVSAAYSAITAAVFVVAMRLVVGPGAPWPLAAVALPVLQVVYTYLRRLAAAARPEAVGYSMALYEAARLPLVYLLVARMRLGILGAVASLAAAHLAAAAYLAVEAARAGFLEPRLVPGLVSRWARLSHIPLLDSLTGLLSGFYRGFFKLVSGSLEAVARLNVGLAAETPLLQAAWVGPSLALYARMLRRVSAGDVAESVRIYLALAGFVLASMAALARPVVALFNPAYLDSTLLVRLAALHALIYGLANIYGAAVGGAERFDADPSRVPPLRVALATPMGRASLARLGSAAAQYALLALLYQALRPAGPAGAALVAMASMLASAAGLLAYLYRLASRTVGAPVPWREAAEVSVASAASVAVYAAMGAPWVAEPRFWPALRLVASALAVGGLAYAAVLLAVSPWARGLAAAAAGRLARLRVAARVD